VNARLWVCVVIGVLVAHLSVLMIVDHIRSSRKPQPKQVEPNFSTSTVTVRAPDGKALKVEHEFTVDTELATPEMLRKLPAPPAKDGAPAAAH
jgi:hypothetical protein